MIKRPDLLMQGLTLLGIVAFALSGLYEGGMLIYSLLGLLFLGILQLMIAIIRGAVMKSKVDLIYFFSALMYCGLLFTSTVLRDFIPGEIEEAIFAWAVACWTIIPFIAGTWYFIYQVKNDLKKAKSDFV